MCILLILDDPVVKWDLSKECSLEVAYAELHEELSQQQLIATEEREAHSWPAESW